MDIETADREGCESEFLRSGGEAGGMVRRKGSKGGKSLATAAQERVGLDMRVKVLAQL